MPDGAAGGAEQRRGADREQVGIVVRRRAPSRAGQEAERDRKRHRGDDGGADDERQNTRRVTMAGLRRMAKRARMVSTPCPERLAAAALSAPLRVLPDLSMCSG